MGTHMLLVQRILNSYINYLGNIAKKRIEGAVFNEYCLQKVGHFFVAAVIYLLDWHVVFRQQMVF